MPPRSITRRTLAVVLLVQIGFALALGSETVWHEWRGRMHALDVQVAGHNDSLLGAIQDAEDPEDNILIDPEELRLPAEDRYAVYSDTGKLIGRSEQGAPLSREGAPGIHTMALDGMRYRVLRRTALRIIDREENGGVGLRRPVVMVYAAPMTHVFHETVEAVGYTLTSILLAALLSGLLASWLLRATLRPIHDLAAAAQRVSPGSLQFDAPPSAMQVQELQPLATTLTALIAELREAFAKEQRFVGDAAHELKTAVAVVRSTIQVLMIRERSEREYVAGLKQILEDNSRVEGILASMLDLARYEQGTAEAAVPLDLNDAVGRACGIMRSAAEARGVRLETEFADPAWVTFPLERAETLITNLLSNSIRHSAPGSAVVVRTRDTGNHVCLDVVDEGSGIGAESLPHVFERFYRDDPSRSRLSGGTGLGLAICKSIVTAAGGSIGIESTPGKGTKVSTVFRKA